MTQVCLVISGSKSNSDWLSNLRCANVDITARECSRDLPDVDPDRVVSVHAGIWAAAVNMDKRCLDLVTKALAERPGWPLVLCGHSLGAGTASLLGMRWRAMGVFPALHVYAFATPPTVDCAKIVADSHSYITAFQCGDDFVTRWCLGTTLDIAKVGHALASEEGVVDELIDVSLYGFRDAATGTCCSPLVRVRLRASGCARAVARGVPALLHPRLPLSAVASAAFHPLSLHLPWQMTHVRCIQNVTQEQARAIRVGDARSSTPRQSRTTMQRTSEASTRSRRGVAVSLLRSSLC